MNTYIGDKYGAILTETAITGGLQLVYSWNSIPSAATAALLGYRALPGGTWVESAGSTVSPRTMNIATGSYEYRIRFAVGVGVYDTITFTLQQLNEDNFLYIPELNPVWFFEKDKTNLPKYFTKHFTDYSPSQRRYSFQEKDKNIRIWQTTDIVYLQLESTFSPLILNLLNENGYAVISLSASASIPHLYLPDVYVYEFSMSLAGLQSGCYQFQLVAGTGIYQKIYLSCCHYIHDGILENTIMYEYSDTKKSNKDVMFATGIQFQARIPGYFGLIDPVRKDEIWRDQSYNNGLLNSKLSSQYPLYLGKGWEGLTEDEIKLLHHIYGCDTIYHDNKLFGLAEGGKIEYINIPRSRKRYMNLTVEEGLNRNSRVFQTIKDPNRRLIATVFADEKIVGAQSGTNTINITNIE